MKITDQTPQSAITGKIGRYEGITWIGWDKAVPGGDISVRQTFKLDKDGQIVMCKDK